MTQAYRGYLIVTHPYDGTLRIEKDGAHISYTASVEDAKRTIDELAQ